MSAKQDRLKSNSIQRLSSLRLSPSQKERLELELKRITSTQNAVEKIISDMEKKGASADAIATQQAHLSRLAERIAKLNAALS